MSGFSFLLMGILITLILVKRDEIYTSFKKEFKAQNTIDEIVKAIVGAIHMVFINPWILIIMLGVAIGVFIKLST